MLGQPAGLSKEVCLYSGADWLKHTARGHFRSTISTLPARLTSDWSRIEFPINRLCRAENGYRKKREVRIIRVGVCLLMSFSVAGLSGDLCLLSEETNLVAVIPCESKLGYG